MLSDEPAVNAFELERQENLRRNRERIAALGLQAAKRDLEAAAAAAAAVDASKAAAQSNNRSKRSRRSAVAHEPVTPRVTRRRAAKEGGISSLSSGVKAEPKTDADAAEQDVPWHYTCENYARLVVLREQRKAATAAASPETSDARPSPAEEGATEGGDMGAKVGVAGGDGASEAAENNRGTSDEGNATAEGEATAGGDGGEGVEGDGGGGDDGVMEPPSGLAAVVPKEPVVRDAGHYSGWVAHDLVGRYGLAGDASSAWLCAELPASTVSRQTSSAKRESARMLKKNPNAFFYRHCEPGVEQAFGNWTDEEHDLFVETMRKHGVGDKWGLFSSHIPRRVGYQCSAYYREVILPMGLAWDSNWRITSGGVAVHVGKGGWYRRRRS